MGTTVYSFIMGTAGFISPTEPSGVGDVGVYGFAGFRPETDSCS